MHFASPRSTVDARETLQQRRHTRHAFCIGGERKCKRGNANCIPSLLEGICSAPPDARCSASPRRAPPDLAARGDGDEAPPPPPGPRPPRALAPRPPLPPPRAEDAPDSGHARPAEEEAADQRRRRRGAAAGRGGPPPRLGRRRASSPQTGPASNWRRRSLNRPGR